MSKIYDQLCNSNPERGEHIPANHRGDDIDTIGSFPCDCGENVEDITNKPAPRSAPRRGYPYSDQRTKDLWEQIDNLGKDTDALKRLGKDLDRMFGKK